MRKIAIMNRGAIGIFKTFFAVLSAEIVQTFLQGHPAIIAF
jgi:hypothetical protein